MVIPHHEYTYVPWALVVFGINNSVSEIYLMLLIPLTIVDKNRCFAYESTITGTLLATVNLVYYIATDVIAQFFLNFNAMGIKIPEDWCRVIICSLCALSSIVLWSYAMTDLKLLGRKGCKCYCRRRNKSKVIKINQSDDKSLGDDTSSQDSEYSSVHDSGRFRSEIDGM